MRLTVCLFRPISIIGIEFKLNYIYSFFGAEPPIRTVPKLPTKRGPAVPLVNGKQKYKSSWWEPTLLIASLSKTWLGSWNTKQGFTPRTSSNGTVVNVLGFEADDKAVAIDKMADNDDE
jgi:hypothetical protein